VHDSPLSKNASAAPGASAWLHWFGRLYSVPGFSICWVSAGKSGGAWGTVGRTGEADRQGKNAWRGDGGGLESSGRSVHDPWAWRRWSPDL